MQSKRVLSTIAWLLGILLLFLLGTVAGSLATVLGAPMYVSYPLMFVPVLLMLALRGRPRAMSSGLPGGTMVMDAPLPGRTMSSPLPGGTMSSLLPGRTMAMDAPLPGGVRARLGLGIASVLATLSLSFLADALVYLLPPMPPALKMALESLTQGNFLENFICVSLMAPFFEEILCRGVILGGLLQRGLRPWLAVIVSALCFALIHGNMWQGIPAFTIGALMGFVYCITRSLKLTMLMHFANNTLSLLLTRVPGLEDMETWVELLGPVPYCITGLACLAVLILCIRYFCSKK